MGHYDAAIELAQRAELKEDRLQLLAVIAKAKRASTMPPEPELMEQIRQLADEIEVEQLGRRTLDLATDLLGVAPDVSMRMLERAYGSRGAAAPLDLAMAAVSLSSLLQDGDAPADIAVLNKRIVDPHLRKVAIQARFTYGGISADEVLSELALFDNDLDRIALLRSWAQAHRSQEGVGVVITEALALVVRHADYVPTTRDLRELATPLQYLTTATDVERLVRQFDEYGKDLGVVGPTIEYVRLELLLALGERALDLGRAQHRFIETYYFVDSIQDPGDKAVAAAWLMKTLPQIDPDGSFDAREHISELLQEELLLHVELVLRSSAEHDVVMRPILQPSSLIAEYIAARRTDDARDIYTTELRPSLDSLAPDDIEARTDAAFYAAPVIYRIRPEFVEELLRDADTSVRDAVYTRVARYILTNTPPDEPIDNQLQQFDASYDDLTLALALAGRIEQDSSIYWIIGAVSSSAMRKDHCSSLQRRNLAGRIETLLADKFPSPRFIQHQGYAILARGHAYRLRGAGSAEWRALTAEVTSVPNDADRAFVLAALAQLVPSRETGLRDTVIGDALKAIDQLPSAYERIEHYNWLASMVQRTDTALAKKCLATAVRLCTGEERSEELKTAERRLVDLAYRVDADFANTLIKTMDDDAARPWARQPARERFEALLLKTKLANDASAVDLSDPELHAKGRLTSASWMMLASLNSNRIAPSRFDDLKALVRAAGRSRLDEAFAVFSFCVESIVQKYSRTPRAREEIRPMFEGALAACAFIDLVSGSRIQPRMTYDRVESGEVIIASGERSRAFGILFEWAEGAAAEYIKIHDPYFSANDLEVVRLFQRASPNCSFQIVTSRSQQIVGDGISIEGVYEQRWREISDQEPPSTEIVIVGLETNGQSPIHDRWVVTRGSGLKLGTSFNSLGVGRDSTITRLGPYEASEAEGLIDTLLLKQRRTHNGARVRYAMIELS